MADMDYEAVKAAQQKMWAEGDFARIGLSQTIVGELLCEAADVLPGDRVLDVACGAGNAALAAARRFAKVTGLDFVPALLDHARERSRAELLDDMEWIEGDAEKLPFEDGSFDVVMSTFGVMFAPNQRKAAAELLRVCRPGGRIAMANWTLDGFVGQLFATTARHVPLPPGLDPPMLWGTEERLRELWGDGISDLRIEHRYAAIRYPSPEYGLEYYRTWFGPTKAALERLEPAAGDAFAADLLALMRRENTAGDRALVMPSGYAEVVATRAG
jgi:SAM-dependent methyltransferase